VTLDHLLGELDGTGRRRGSEPAFVASNGRVLLRHAELARLVERRSGALAAAGLGSGDRIAFGVRSGPDGFAWLLACFRAGITVAILDPGVGRHLLEARCRAAGVTAVLLDPGVHLLSGNRLGRAIARAGGVVLPQPRSLAERVLVTGPVLGSGATRVDRLIGPPPGPGWPDDAAPALIVFTSGTTGTPRGVVHTPRSIVASIEAVRELADLRPDSLVLASAPNFVVPTLLAGGAVVMPPRQADRLARTTRERGVTHLALAPHRAVAWTEAGGASPALRRLFLGTAPLRAAALRRILPALPPRATAWGIYGLTELLLVASVSGGERLAHDEADGDLVGTPIAGARIRIADDGEVRVAGPGLARGYVAELLLDGEAALDEIATGDLGRMDSRGRLVLLGRRKEMLIRRGENIYPSLYEPALVERGRLAEAALVGVPDELGDERAVLWVVPARGETSATVVARVVRLLAGPDSPFDGHARPDAILALDRLPRSGRSEKVDRRALVTLAAGRLGLALFDDPILPQEA
jgi:acyl-CoA synthetase (AMP-forming)/AMP-acid ligase II